MIIWILSFKADIIKNWQSYKRVDYLKHNHKNIMRKKIFQQTWKRSPIESKKIDTVEWASKEVKIRNADVPIFPKKT